MSVLADEPELVHAVAKVAARLNAEEAGLVIDLASAIFDAGFAAGIVSKVVPSPSLRDALARARKAIPQ